MDIEKEVQARVEFKFNELLEGVKNRIGREFNLTLNTNNQKHLHYWEAFSEFEKMLRKEIMLPTPYDDMAEHNRRKKRDEVVDKLKKRFLKRGREFDHEQRVIVVLVEEAQDY